MVRTSMNSFQARATRDMGAAMIALAMVSGASAQQSFKTPQEAVEPLVIAIRSGDDKAVSAILGLCAERIMSAGDAVQDQNIRKAFLASYDRKHSVAIGD